jgi:hypothetical protein
MLPGTVFIRTIITTVRFFEVGRLFEFGVPRLRGSDRLKAELQTKLRRLKRGDQIALFFFFHGTRSLRDSSRRLLQGELEPPYVDCYLFLDIFGLDSPCPTPSVRIGA